jgi:hypothetical protein
MSRKQTPEPQKLNSQTNYQGAFMSYPTTPEEQELADYNFDDTRYNAATASAFGDAKRNIIEGAGGYSGITNPVTAARIQQIGLEELADQESSALTAAEKERNALKLQNKQFLASLRRPQYITTGQSGYQEQFAPQQGGSNIASSGILAGGSILAATL